MSRKMHPDKDQSLPVQSRLLLYRTEDGQTRVEVRLQDETVWLNQSAMAELYQTTPQNITLHLKAIYHEGELDESATCKEFLQVQDEGALQFFDGDIHIPPPPPQEHHMFKNGGPTQYG